MTEGIILNKFIGNLGIYSRKEADELIKEKRVRVNGKLAKPGMRLEEGDKVSIDGEEVGSMVKKRKPSYIVMNKPYGVVCSTNKAAKNNIIEFIDHEKQVIPITKLEKESTGIVILSDDNQINKRKRELIQKQEQEYFLTVNHKITREFIHALEKGIHHKRRKFPKAKVKRLSKNTMSITIPSADDRTVKIMCGSQGYRVKEIMKLSIATIRITKLKPGKWRNLTPTELTKLKGIISKA